MTSPGETLTDSHHSLDFLGSLDPRLIKTDISNRVMMPMWRHVAEAYGEEAAQKMLDMVGVPSAYMQDPTRWVGLEYSRKMVEVMAREIHGLDHPPDIQHPMWEFYRESGQRSLSKEALGMVWYAMRLLGSPRLLYENIPSQARRMNLLTHFEVVEYGYGHAVIAAWPERGYDLASFCKSRQGYLEAVPTLWGYPPALVEHPECIHDPTNPSRQCLYRVTFREFGRLSRAMAQTVAMSVAVGTGSGLVLGNIFDPWGAALGAFVTAGMAGWWFFMRQYFRERSDSRHIEAAIERFDRRHQEVLDSETLFRQLADNVNELFWLAEPDRGQYDYLSPHFGTLFGFDPAELLEDSTLWEKAVYEEDRSARQAWILGGGLGETTYRIRRPGGEIRWLRERVFPVGEDDEPVSHIAGLCEDITEKIGTEERLKKQEEELRQAQKMEAVGRLAGGIAHDFNNLLTGIIGNLSMVAADIDENSPIQEHLDEIRQASQRAAGLTRQLLMFSRKELIRPTVVPFNRVVSDLQKMLKRLVEESIQLVAELRPEVGQVKIDIGQMEQVLINLVMNARDALKPGGGRIVLRTSQVTLEDPTPLAFGIVPPGRFAVLEVEDNGVGMSQETQDHIFEPFFTTKAKGKGTGLGLATVFGIITRWDGHLDVHSRQGKGSCFRIYLPVASEETVSPESPETPPTLMEGRERILVVEDESVVRRMARRTLKRLGYDVHSACTGEEAITLMESLHGQIDLMITDVIMPGINGRQLAETLRRRWPDLRVLFTSGYTDEIIAPQGVLEDDVFFLPKPYGPDLLAQVIRKMLD